MGFRRTVNEIAYYVVYKTLLQSQEHKLLYETLERICPTPGRSLDEISQLQVDSLDCPELLDRLRALKLDAAFVMCLHAYLPVELTEIPRHGTFLWHEGFTPDYRGICPAFWALVKQDYGRLGYTLLKVNKRIDGGDIYLQG